MTFLVPIFVDILYSLATKKVIATLLVELCRAFAKATENEYDDHVIGAMAEAIGVDLPK